MLTFTEIREVAKDAGVTFIFALEIMEQNPELTAIQLFTAIQNTK